MLNPLAGRLLQIAARFPHGFHDRREAVKKNSRGKNKKKGDRDRVDQVVLHSMSFDWGLAVSPYDRVNCHFAVLRDGKVLYLHDWSELLWASHDFNSTGIAIEFAGNPPDASGTAYKEHKFGKHIPTRQQIEGGRALVRTLTETHSLTEIHPHRQACAKVCPGPHIWYNVGEWAMRELGLSDGGVGYSTGNEYCTGTTIPEVWRDDKFDLMAAGPSWASMSHGNGCIPP